MTRELIDMKHSYTCNGEPVRLLCTDALGEYPVLGHVGNSEYTRSWTAVGCFIASGRASEMDLVRISTKHEGWINLYRKDTDLIVAGTLVHKTKEMALEGRLPNAVVGHVTWEE
jgi:hypothetical protein